MLAFREDVERPYDGKEKRMAGKSTMGAVVIACLAFLAAGCDSSYEPSGNEPPVQEAVEPLPEQPPAPEPDPVWECFYEPTYDDDWHNDVLCSNGAESDRPYLREWDDFVTEDEIMESAREYEDQLNSA